MFKIIVVLNKTLINLFIRINILLYFIKEFLKKLKYLNKSLLFFISF